MKEKAPPKKPPAKRKRKVRSVQSGALAHRPEPVATEPASSLAGRLNEAIERKGIEVAPTAAPDGSFDPATEARKLNIWRLNQAGGGFFMPGPKKEDAWNVFNSGELKLELKTRGISCARPEDSAVSDAQRLVHYIQNYRNVAASAEALAGYRAGVHAINTREILVRTNFRLVEPCPGDFPTLRGLIESNLKQKNGRDYSPYFYGWLKVAYQSLRESSFRVGQILYLVGPPGCGKSRLQHNIITPLLGGRAADPLHYLTGRSNFNEDLAGSEHLLVEDPDTSSKYDERDTMGKRLKQFAANESQRLHPKNSRAFTFNPFWRISLSQNDEQASLDTMP